MGLDAEKIREDFPILSRMMNGKPLAYLDNAATTQKPVQVLEAMDGYYLSHNANIHRGAYRLSEEATGDYEAARKNVADFIGAKRDEIIFTKNATESLNLVAAITCENSKRGSSALLTQMEHHSNIVPWQMAAKRNGLRVGYVKIRGGGTLCNEDLDEKLASSPSIFSFTHVSNALGTINDARTLCKKAKKAGALSCVDAAQSVPHMKVDVNELGCDFLAFSGHKMLGPTGIGVLYMRRELQEKLPPFLGGGDMIKQVGFEGASWNEPPYKFEAGTQNAAGAVGLSAAIDYLKKVGLGNISAHEQKLRKMCIGELSSSPCIKFYGPKHGAGIVSFNIGKMHAHDAGEFANRDGVAIRAGHHCAQPLMKLLGVPATCRASFYIYNTEEEVERLASSMKKAEKVLG
ncbi:Cysteine desulfurase [uncultured archaeon]|nr:Cysteine desulfurase [uncultured archaeon]